MEIGAAPSSLPPERGPNGGRHAGRAEERDERLTGLQGSAAYTTAVLASALDCVITIDHEGAILEFNPAAERTFGYARADVLGRELAELIIPPDLRDGHRQALARWARTGHPAGNGGLLGNRVKLRGMRADGSELPLEVAISRLEVEGSPLFTASLRDITSRTRAEAELRAAEARYRTLVERLPLITYVDSPDSAAAPLYLSPQVEAILGYGAEEWMARPGLFERRLHPDDRERIVAEKRHAYERAEPHRAEYRMIAADGRVVWIHDESVVVREPGGRSYRQGFAVDVTERKLSEQALLEAEAKYRTLVEQLPLVIYADALDPESSNIYSSPQIEPLLGYTPEDWRSDPLLFVKLLHPEDREHVLAAHARAHETGEPLRLEYRLIARDGRIVWVADEACVTKDAQGTPLFLQGCLLDVTARKEAEQRLRHQAFHDPLTDLPNRALFTDRVEQALLRRRASGQGAVLFLDLDDFKSVNDSLGHPAGDELLRAVGERLQGALRLGDTVARFGGDEFAVLVEEVGDPTEAAQTAERIARALAAPFVIADRELFASASIGIAIGGDVEELLRQADVAMYRAKAQGKGQFAFYEAAMDEAIVERLHLTTDLRKASVNREFVLHYQPIVDLAGGRIAGVEALLRWLHPGRGLLQPLQFIPLAEQTGLIVPIGRWVLTEACAQAARWHAEQDPERRLTMSVNVSCRQLEHPSLVGAVVGALAESQLEPQLLMLELTESALIESGDEGSRKLRELKELGVRLALDDFGTGYSSLWALESLPVDTVKIDRSFVHVMERGHRQWSLIKGIVDLALALGLDVVAEGIETAEQVQALTGLGCPRGQGFHFGEPLERGAVSAALARDGLLVRSGRTA